MKGMMMTKIGNPIPDSVLRSQARAAHPARNVWLSANAGSGKTHVLTERVIRLLLAGANPAQILCLTYTKAAASVMQTRIFARLSQWTRLDDEELSRQLTELEGDTVTAAHLITARQLFARALETPGGLKIQTIHAFCESILHQFPLEANIAGHFELLDDMAALDLMRHARREVIEKAWCGEDEHLSAAFELVLAHVGEHGLDKLFHEAINKREALKPYLKRFAQSADQIFYAPFQLDAAQTQEQLARDLKRAALFSEEDMAIFKKYGGETVRKFIAILDKLRFSEDVRQFIPLVMQAYYTQKGLRKYSGLSTKALQEAAPEMEMQFTAKQERIADLLDKIRSLQLIDLNVAAYRLISCLNEIYAKLKRNQALLDFDDLIYRTIALLKRSHASRWVHYKLDQSISHILVDEAQDTSPAQWQIIRLLANEFFSGEALSEANRTLFAVGDEKQSIYSFQGAVPEDFAASGTNFGKSARAAHKFFDQLRLDFSFRSTPDILAAVDEVFASQANYQGLSAAAAPPIHKAVRAKSTGEVDIWAAIKPKETQEPDDWLTLQEKSDEPAVILARQIAETIENWLKNGEPIIGQERLMNAGDIMVLIRARGDPFVPALVRELKKRSIAVAGADRLRLNDHIAVRDLMALARFVLQPFDDLSLASVLKSPLFGLDEEELYQLAQPRGVKERLHQSLERQANDNPKFEYAHQALTRYRTLADVVPAYEFYSQILSVEGGRRKILSRLGSQAGEVLDAFLDLTIAIQKKGLPGLQSFLETLNESAPEIKRELGVAAGEVRIMTVHAAKGQESSVVFLVDNGKAISNPKLAPKLIPIKGIPLWNPGKKYQTKVVEKKIAELQQREEQEYRRLLYVGMTRAEDRLIVCGYQSKKAQQGTWLDLVTNALQDKTFPLLPPPVEGVEAHRFRLNSGQLPLAQPTIEPQAAPCLPPPPDFLFDKITTLPPKPRTLTPSHAAHLMLDEENHLPTASLLPENGHASTPSMAIRRGLISHHLLQYLPDVAPERRVELARSFILQQAPDWPPTEQQRIEQDVLGLLQDDRLQRLFAPTSRAEVNIMGTIEINGVGRPVSGQIDRLSIFDNEILLADFKTGRPPQKDQDIPQAYLMQMALYRRLLMQIYPHHTICPLLIYTGGIPILFPLDNSKLDCLLEKL